MIKKIITAILLIIPFASFSLPEHYIPVPETSASIRGYQRVPEEVHYIDELKNLLAEGRNEAASKLLYNLIKSDKVRRKIPTLWPVKGGGIITSPFGYRYSPFSTHLELHPGIDIAFGPGVPIIATADGIVENSETSRGYGILVIIRHAYGFSTFYGHLMRSCVNDGDIVKRGQIIGYMGSTGRSSGVHLHYEVRVTEIPTDPRLFMFVRSF
jgi:murein DD-endopeptidase MepM/ murein hydrolase activator NlpD